LAGAAHHRPERTLLTGRRPGATPFAKERLTIELTTLEVTDLKQWRYCPRIVWYRHCLPQIRPVTSLMRQGIEAHQDEAAREERRSLRAYGLAVGERAFDLRLQSAHLGLRGRLDLAIATPDRATPGATGIVVEYKYSEQRAGAHFKLQLAAYALLLEEAWDLPVPVGFLYQIPLRRAERVPITAALRRQVAATTDAIHRAITTEALPAPPVSRRPCVTCEFRRFCADVV
jgi:CRISPR-associated exonuclease Cas4